MSIVFRPIRIQIGDGTAIPSTFATVAAGDLAVVKRDMTLLTPGQTIADSDEIYIAQGTASNPQLSAPIKGSSVVSWAGESFKPGIKQTSHIGYDRITAQSINVLNSTEYSLAILLKDDKDLFSHRQLRKLYFYTSSTTATAKEILENLASQIQLDINNSGELLPLQVTVIGDGTGESTTATVNGVTVRYHDITAATNFGLEITGTEYTFNQLKGYQKVFFELGINTGFDTTTVVSNTQAMFLGIGTYGQVYMIEDYGLFYYGFTNRRMFPVLTPTRYTVATPTEVASTAGGTVTTVSGDDEITFSTAPGTAIPAGSILTLSGGDVLEIKFFKSSTVAVCTSNSATSTASQTYTLKQFYDLYTIEHNDDSASGEINGRSVNAPIRTMIAVPPNSTQGADLEARLNPWMASTPKAFTSVTL